MRVVVSTRNRHKLDELGQILTGFELLPLPDEVELPPEEADTFTGNALGKARAAAEATGLPAIADDSGITAVALGGAPGVRSARYAGENATDEQNLDKLIAEVGRHDDRRVAYVCALVYVEPDGREVVAEGECTGVLLDGKRGDGGFGYDPAFIPDDTGPEDNRTMAELSPQEKHSISHRGRAARELARKLGL